MWRSFAVETVCPKDTTDVPLASARAYLAKRGTGLRAAADISQRPPNIAIYEYTP